MSMRLDKIKNYDQLSRVLEESSWQRFEEIVGKIFELNDYEVEIGRVVSFGGTKRQYDVIAREENCILVDCKKWDNKRRIKHGLKRAVSDQTERVEMFESDMEKYPLLVTSSQSPIEFYEGVPIVPVYKLNLFLSNIQTNLDKILKIK